MELTKDPNFRNYFYKFEAYPFRMNEIRCNKIHNIFKIGFKAGLQKYPNINDKLHHAWIINRKEYPGYEGYGIQAGTNSIKIA